jgi:hypothetical protein
MAVLLHCSVCDHQQMIGHNEDGRLLWWTRCEECGRGDFQARPDPKTIDAIIAAFVDADALESVKESAEAEPLKTQAFA